jgi:hypothetical protein
MNLNSLNNRKPNLRTYTGYLETIQKHMNPTKEYTHRRFERHEIFEQDDRTLVLNMIQSTYGTGDCDSEITNMLFGLFDGYWYDRLMTDLHESKIFKPSTLIELSEILDRIEDSI